MSPPSVIGIDIGGSKTTGVRVTPGQPDRRSDCGSASITSVGPAEAAAQLDRLTAALGTDDVVAVYAGAAGVDGPRGAQILAALLAQRFPDARVQVVHDTRVVLAAAGLNVGTVIISGTGSVAWGRNDAGDEARAGGWGYLLGDAGSGYGIARAAVQHVLRRADSGAPTDALTRAMCDAVRVSTAAALLDRFYHLPSRRKWSQTAGVVFDLHDTSGDPASTQLIAGAADELAEDGARVCRRLGMEGPVVLAGGLLVHRPALQRMVVDRLRAKGLTDVRVLEADPVRGAVALAHDGLRATDDALRSPAGR